MIKNKYLRQTKHWLGYTVMKRLRQQRPDLFKSRTQIVSDNCQKRIFGKGKWWVILIFIAILYYLALKINIGWLNIFQLKVESAKAIVDSRASNTATIISMTLAVVGFLLSNLATKDAFAYQLLFKNTKLFAIIYFTLGTIASLMLLSLLKDTITDEYIYGRLAICGSYLVLTVLFLIGFLFSRIISFSSAKHIQQLLHDELMVEGKQHLKQRLYIELCQSVFKEKVVEFGAEANDYSKFHGFVAFGDPVSTSKEQYLISDIHLGRVSKFITKKLAEGKIYFREIKLNELTSQIDQFLYVGGIKNSEEENLELRNCLVLAEKPEDPIYVKDMRSYFDSRLENYVTENKQKDLKEVLKSYLDLYNLEMKNSSHV